MTEEKYNTKDIRHINEKNQEYIAENNRMTREIIIDGVNVAGCRHCMYKGFKAFPQCRLELDSFAIACTQHKECEYKQLKRLEQERNEWKKKYEDVANENLKEIYELIKKNDCWRGVVNVVCSKLEQENKELKEKNKNIKAHKDFLFKENDKLMRDNSIMRIALNEIKNITTNALAKQRPYKEDFIEIKDIINKIAERPEKNKYRSVLEEIRKDFICFRTCMLPFHIGNKENLPHNMADAIQDYCESIKNKIDEVLNDSEC